MNDDSENKNLEANFSRKLGDNMFNVGNVPKSIWVRLPFQDDFRLDEFLLAYGRYFLLRVGTFLFIIYLFQKFI